MRIILMSDSICIPTGMGRLTRELALGLQRKGHDLAHIGWFQHSEIPAVQPHGMKCWYTNNNHYGADVLDNIVNKFQPDILLTIGDFWWLHYIADTNICRTRRHFQWCFKGDTEVVTRSGIKNIKEVAVGEEVLSVSPKDGSVSYKKITATHQPWFEGNLVNIKGKYVDFSVTPDHRFLMRPIHKKNMEWMTARNILSMIGSTSRLEFPKTSPVNLERKLLFRAIDYLPDNFEVVFFEEDMELVNAYGIESILRHHASPKVFSATVGEVKKSGIRQDVLRRAIVKGNKKDRSAFPAIMDMGDFLELAGWFISEGSIERGECNRIHIAQQEENKFEISHRREIKSLLDKIGINYKEKKSGFTIAGLPIVELMSLFGDKSRNKRIPEWIFSMSHEELERLFKSMMMGDGTRGGDLYCTISKPLKEDFLRLCLHLGYSAKISSQGVFVRKFRNANAISGSHVSEESYFGQVYCVTVEENGTLLAGRNGKFQFTGNCSYIPVDGEPLCGGIPPAIKHVIEDIDIPVAYTDYAKNAVLKSIFDQETRNRIRTIYHGVDTNMFKPANKKKKQEIRNKYGIEDKFVFLTVCRNQSRKNIPELFRIWKKFSELPETKDKVILWPHMFFNDSMGWNIDDLLTVIGLKNHSIMYFDQIAHSGSEMFLLPEEQLAELYQIADAFILLSGEGFGLPTFEAMATGLPCVLLDHSASGELGAGSRAELVPVGGSLTWTGSHLTQRPVPDFDRAVSSMLKVFSDRVHRESIAKAGYDFAIQYPWARVVDEWHNLFIEHEVPFIKPKKLEVII